MWYLLLTDPLWQYHSVVGGGRLLVAPVISKVARMTEFLKCQELLALPPKRANPKVALPFKKYLGNHKLHSFIVPSFEMIPDSIGPSSQLTRYRAS